MITEIARHIEEDYDPNYKEQVDYQKILYKFVEKAKRGVTPISNRARLTIEVSKHNCFFLYILI